MMSMLHLLWIVPLVAGVAWGWGYKANPERVKAFVKKHIVDEDPYQDEGHSATRYAPEPGESPIACEARKAAEVWTARPEEIEAVKMIAVDGICLGVLCSDCPWGPGEGHPEFEAEPDYVDTPVRLPNAAIKRVARRWLLDHGINPDEASKAAEVGTRDDYIDWSKVPDGYDWVGVNSKGDAYMAKTELAFYLSVGCNYGFLFSQDGSLDNAPKSAIVGPLPPWRESLHKRPS